MILADEEYISPVILIAAAGIGALCLFLGSFGEHPIRYGTLIGMDLLLLLLFYSCRITITGDAVTIRYGIGVVRREFPRHSVEATRAVPNEHILAWVYRPMSERALLIQIRNGPDIVLPTTSPLELSETIKFSPRR